MCKIKCLLILLGFNFFGVLCLYFFGSDFSKMLLNFEVGFFGFLLINIANFFGLKKRIRDEVENLQLEEKKKKYSKWVLGLQIFSLWARMLAYTLMILGIFLLIYFNVFHIYSILIGILMNLLGVVFLQFLNLKRQ